MKDLLKIIAYIELVAGGISALMFSYTGGVTISLNGTDRNWFLTILIFAISAGGTFFIYVVLTAIAEILQNQEDIIDQLGGVSEQTAKPDPNTWECPKCGKRNPNYTGTCSCGTSRP